MLPRLLRIIKRIALMVALLWLALTLLLWLNQRNVLFQPSPGPTTPEAANLPGYHLAYVTATDGETIPYWYHPDNSCSSMEREEAQGADHAAKRNEGGELRSERGGPACFAREHKRLARVACGAPPCSRSEPQKPILLYFHGNGGGLHAFTGPLHRLAQQGYEVLAMEYRGYPGAPGTPSEKAIVEDAYTLAQSHLEKNPDRPVVIWGYSLGSGVATQLAARLKQDRVLILEAPFTSAADLASSYYPYLPVRTLMKDPFDSKAHIADIDASLFLMHGRADTIIPSLHTESLYNVAVPPKKRITYRTADHFNLSKYGAYEDAFAYIAAHTPGSNIPASRTE